MRDRLRHLKTMREKMPLALPTPRLACLGNDLLGFSAELERRFEAGTSPASRKEKGQFFTPAAVCGFMAGLFSAVPKHFRLLDAGAGVGALSAAVCERVLQLRSPHSLEIHLFENDPALTPLLEENLRNCRIALERAGHRLNYALHADDFLTVAARREGETWLFATGEDLGDFDGVIMNPPYFKIGGASAHARGMRHVVHGQPNIYALFLAKAAELLRPEGELIAITPRSFCNGLYFRDFRRWFFARMALQRIHLFESRTEAFQGANILQESIITRWQRLGQPSVSVAISTSFGADLPRTLDVQTLPADAVVDDSCGALMVRVPASIEEAKILKVTEAWAARFNELGLRVSTGPVVLFRAKQFLLQELDGRDTAPLLTVHNVRPFQTVWPVPRRNKPTAFRVCAGSLKHLVPTRNYVLLRRFSAKEERRRLTASCLLAEQEQRPYLALENHLNYVYHAERELAAEETFGLAALFNSALLDRYFRVISGNTQVNATEIRTMKFPELASIARIGKRVRKLPGCPPAAVEQIVLQELGINGLLERYLTQLATAT
jgi:adenine-specific DNA-methyltransferase